MNVIEYFLNKGSKQGIIVVTPRRKFIKRDALTGY